MSELETNQADWWMEQIPNENVDNPCDILIMFEEEEEEYEII